MKLFKRALCVVCLLVCTSSFAQLPAWYTQLQAFRGYNNTSITTKTGPNSITPINVGGNIDSVIRYIDSFVLSVATGTNLQTVTTIGARTTIPISLGRTVADQTVGDSAGLLNTHNSELAWQFTTIADIPTWGIASGDLNGFVSVIQPGIFTGLNQYIIPDKGGTTDTFAMKSDLTPASNPGLDDVIVTNRLATHVAKWNTPATSDSISVGDGEVYVKNGSSVTAKVRMSKTDGLVLGGTSFGGLARLFYTNTTNSSDFVVDDYGASTTQHFAMKSDITGGIIAADSLIASTNTATVTVVDYTTTSGGLYNIYASYTPTIAGGYSSFVGVEYTQSGGGTSTGFYEIRATPINAFSVTGVYRLNPITIWADGGTHIRVKVYGNSTGTTTFSILSSIQKASP